MCANRVQTLRSSVTGAVPNPNSRQPGELWVNFADAQLGCIDPTQTAQRLLAVRLFTNNATYAVGDFVVQGGVLYRAIAPSSAGGFNAANWSGVGTMQDLAGYLPLAGGTLTGPLTLPAAAPANANQATNKSYVDLGDAASLQAANAKLPLAGGTLTGALTLSGAPTSPLHAATKGYVDSGAFVPITGGTMTGPLTLSGNATASFGAVTLQQMQAANASYLPLAGGTLTGSLFGVGATFSGYFTVQTQIAVAPVSGTAGFVLQKPASGQDNIISGYTGANARWTMELGDPSAETGGNVGSNFALNRYNDAGTWLDTPVFINRATGLVTISQGLTVSQYLSAKGVYCKAGINAGITANVHNMVYVAPNMGLWVDATALGVISVSSDYRIKQKVEDLPSMWERAKALRPISYEIKDYTPHWELGADSVRSADDAPMFVADGVERWGFIAHELQETLIQDAATGVKDEDNLIQSPNPWTVIATLTKALQEAMTRIEALERVDQLEARA